MIQVNFIVDLMVLIDYELEGELQIIELVMLNLLINLLGIMLFVLLILPTAPLIIE